MTAPDDEALRLAQTPRTDEHLSHLNLPSGYKIGLPYQTVDLMRDLERELNALLAENAETWKEAAARYENQRNAAEAEAERLRRELEQTRKRSVESFAASCRWRNIGGSDERYQSLAAPEPKP